MDDEIKLLTESSSALLPSESYREKNKKFSLIHILTTRCRSRGGGAGCFVYISTPVDGIVVGVFAVRVLFGKKLYLKYLIF